MLLLTVSNTFHVRPSVLLAFLAAKWVGSGRMAMLRAVGLWVFSVAPWCLLSGLQAPAMAKQIFHPPAWPQEFDAEHCPASCQDVFPRLTCDGDCAGGMEQHVEIQERGGERVCKLELDYGVQQ